jgi:hypothetical protein
MSKLTITNDLRKASFRYDDEEQVLTIYPKNGEPSRTVEDISREEAIKFCRLARGE